MASVRGALKWRFGQQNNTHIFLAHDASNSKAKNKEQRQTLKNMYLGIENILEKEMTPETGPLKTPLDGSRLHVISTGQTEKCMKLAMAA